MERADNLETQCTLLDGRVRNLMQEIAEKEKDKIESKEKNTIAVQTDHIFKASFLSFFAVQNSSNYLRELYFQISALIGSQYN